MHYFGIIFAKCVVASIDLSCDVICAQWIFMQVAWMGLSTGHNVVKLLCNPLQW
jgi:hypothetical protein